MGIYTNHTTEYDRNTCYIKSSICSIIIPEVSCKIGNTEIVPGTHHIHINDKNTTNIQISTGLQQIQGKKKDILNK